MTHFEFFFPFFQLKRCQKSEGPATVESTHFAGEISDALAAKPEINSENTGEAAAARELCALLSSTQPHPGYLECSETVAGMREKYMF